ncbi:DUF533 domain-containing protein [Jannaschia seohaensis]|uniref:Uncharacterized membrane protein YebE (DUF533 family) n=1 Tax=Jannaschia seohaensis TaxID=475081 RepID=A0A2Y9AVN9_9RHOB|nr:DUF533 domain-containing protein [Jannaschia seohaensis]PWJ18063.1 uncharacterized membrane protein YebE (DUF533 family) [Jannaschia seohaensis]SSA46587.1 Uncharacterized membrane protein YebE, DUF533 family [Jannaschia seohaensis]
MSLKRTAMRMAIAFAAAKGYQAFRARGGMRGLRDELNRVGGSGGLLGGRDGGGLGAVLNALGSGASTPGGLGGILGGLAAMAGGSGALGGLGTTHTMEMAERGPQDDETARAMIRAIGQAVRADGEIDAAEREILHDLMGEMETEEERAALDAGLREPVDPEALARDVPIGHEAEVYAAALTAIDPDRQAETAFLSSFARALRLPEAEVAQLHAAAGKAR